MDDQDDKTKCSLLQQDQAESILITLDQISQTIEVMTSVVGRLKQQIQSQSGNNATPMDTTEVNRTLH
ncbi:MAG: hypothetical protein AAF756_00260 [Pseudomonadota bacterium]